MRHHNAGARIGGPDQQPGEQRVSSMGRWWRIGLALTLAALPAQPIAAAVSSQGGLSFESEDGAYNFELGGRLMWDMDSFDGILNLPNGGDRRFNSRLRRARLELAGQFPGDFEWIFDVNFLDDGSGGDAEVHAAGLRYTGWQAAEVFVGRIKEPFGLEELTSSKAISSMRRAVLTEATDADNQPYYGIRFDGMLGKVGWSVGAFNPNGNPSTDDGSDRFALTGRVFTAPIAADDRVLHLGAAYTDRNLDQAEELTAFRLGIAESADERPVADALLAREDRQVGLEALYIHGAWSLQSEYFLRELRGAEAAPDADVRSHYLQGTWTVTGQGRRYDPRQGIPEIIRPDGPGGAVELVARWERIVFDRPEQVNPTARLYVGGINWYVNRNVKLMLNVTRLETDDVAADVAEDDALVYSGRIQVAF